MYPYIVCFCGRSLGDLHDIFKAMKNAKYAEVYGNLDYEIDPSVLAITESIQIDLSDIFEMLNLHMDCCKTRINTQVEFKDLY